MKTHRNTGLAALVVFIISFFLPAFEGMSGFASFAFCWDTLLGHEPFGNVRTFSGGWIYYSGFVISNVLFVGLVAALFLTRKTGRIRSVFSVVCFLQVLSWLVLFLISEKPSQIAAIKVGYYLWLIAYGLLVSAHFYGGRNGARSYDAAGGFWGRRKWKLQNENCKFQNGNWDRACRAE